KFCGWTENKKKYIADNLFKIRHWKVALKEYKDIENINATWFIDPPYQFGGKYYRHRKIDYVYLKDWCLSRKGQVIVCENSKANWMEFKPLVNIFGQRHK